MCVILNKQESTDGTLWKFLTLIPNYVHFTGLYMILIYDTTIEMSCVI